MDTEGPNNTVHVGLGEGSTVRMPGLQLYTRKVGGEQTGGAFSLFEVEVGPGGGDGPHVQHREDECFYIVEGRFEFVIEGAGIEAGTGSLVYATKGELHAFENVGEGVGRLLILHTPGGPHERFVKEVGEPAALGIGPNDNGDVSRAEGVPEVGKAARLATEYGIELVPTS
jgi:mannose-6-phosphate isomerase-like protein (cupin superfamily)